MNQTRRDQLAQEIMETFARYAEAFDASDIDGINQFVSYPLAYVGDGQVALIHEWPVNPAELKASKGWHETVGVELEVVGVNGKRYGRSICL